MRSTEIALESAVAFWNLLLPVGLSGGALSHVDDLSATTPASTYAGWRELHDQWWFDYLEGKNVKGVSKDTWSMVGSKISFPQLFVPDLSTCSL